MSEKKTSAQRTMSPDWFVRGILTRIGEAFDKLTGRNWKPSSSLATSELIERLKKLLDAKVKDLGENGRFVPHNIKLKMQWDKFSTDSEESLKKLEHELLAAAIDHINDNRYHTYAPLKVEIKLDYFTEGVNLFVSFDKFAPEEETEDMVKVTMPDVNLKHIIIANPAQEEAEPEPETEKIVAEFKIDNKEKQVELEFTPNRRLNVGRTKENDLTIEDASVSKIHASLVLNNENQLMVADTGSTNGTFINNQRIAYGKALAIGEADKVKFGTVEVYFRRVPKPAEFATRESYDEAANFQTEQITEVGREVNQAFATKQNYPILEESQQSSEESFKTNESHNVGTHQDEAGSNRDNPHDGSSQTFRTEQRVKLDFGDDHQK